MSPVFDFKCPNGHVRLDVSTSAFTRNPVEPCEHCGLPMEKQWSSSNFNIKGYAESNGYSRKNS